MGCNISATSKPENRDVEDEDANDLNALRDKHNKRITTQQYLLLEKTPHLWTNPELVSRHINAVWEHYAKGPQYKKNDK